uniref:Si:ch211-110p13.9 n=2 Tax=Nothobranchius korthausae TaxID=1143690 RepID=A0A1A8FEB5_9TELE
MSSRSVTHLALPQWDGGSRKIRFIYLVNLTSFKLTNCPNHGTATPLYLGADLLSNTDIRTENHPRYHAKFAKKGLATKLKFSSAFRFQGLKVPAANNSLWFYSIQGLFRVAFEMFSKQDQLAVLENFQEVWKSQINESPLKTTYSLSVQLDSLLSADVSDESKSGMPGHHYQADGDMVHVCDGGTVDTSADHDYCSSSRHGLQTDQSQMIVDALTEKLHSLEDQLSSPSESCAERLETVLLLLTSVDQYMKGNLKEEDATETVLALLKAENWVKDSVYSSYLLTCVGRWLGQQFHAANSSISQRVEGFKVQHIERISDLPPAEELTAELFPEAMQTLRLHWMGFCEEATLEKRHSEYPILLLILEFANHNLITGVAHVLYSSLICK